MLNIGRKQKLVVVKKVEFGIYLGETREAGEKERVLLPIKQVPEGTKEGDDCPAAVSEPGVGRTRQGL